MGFTVTSALFGLPSLTWYITIKGTYTIEKNAPTQGAYRITYTVYYSAGANQPIIKQDVCFLILQQLPDPANLYTSIYDDIKKNIDPSNSLSFIDD